MTIITAPEFEINYDVSFESFQRETIMKRRHFLTQFFFFMLATACSSKSSVYSTPPASGTQPVTPAACSTQNPNIMIAINHGHTLVVPIVNVINETASIYTLTMGDGHTHSLSLSTSEMQTLKSSLTITVSTTFDSGHSHSVTITCIG